MAYVPPNHNAVNFDFADTGYVAPNHDAVNFNFISSPNERLHLNQQWSVAALDSEQNALDQQWQVITTTIENFACNHLWVVEANSAFRFILDQQWLVDPVLSTDHQLTQQWITTVAPSEQSQLTQQWAVELAPSETYKLGQYWAVEQAGIQRFDLDQHWQILGNSSDKLDITQQWGVEGTPAEALHFNQQWLTEGVPTEQFTIDQQWETFSPEEDFLLTDQQWQTLVVASETFHLNQTYYFRYTVGKETVILYGNTVGSALVLHVGIGRTRVQQECVLRSDLLSRVQQEWVVGSNIGSVRNSLDIVYHIAARVQQEWEMPFHMVSRVQQEFVSRQDIAAVDKVSKELVVVVPLLGQASVVITDPPTVTINGSVIQVQDAEINIDEGQFAWTCQFTLNDAAHYSLFQSGAAFALVFGGETYQFLLDRKDLSRTGQVEIQATISGISPSAQFTDPRASKITKTWETPVLASAVATEVMGSVDWQILDWSLPAFRLGVENQTPVEIVQLIAKAAGALLETTPGGALYVRYIFPKSVTEYLTLTPDQEYSDLEHNFSVSEQFQNQKVVNKLRILDIADDAKRDRVEFVQDEHNPDIGFLKVFPSPWRETVTVEHTSLPTVSAHFVAIEEEEKEETVEVIEGKGSVSHPIYSITTLEWLYVNLTGVTFESDSNEFRSTHPTNKESLLKITYRTRYLRFNVAAFANAEVQFLVKDGA